MWCAIAMATLSLSVSLYTFLYFNILLILQKFYVLEILLRTVKMPYMIIDFKIF